MPRVSVRLAAQVVPWHTFNFFGLRPIDLEACHPKYEGCRGQAEAFGLLCCGVDLLGQAFTLRENIQVALAYGGATGTPPSIAELLEEYRLKEVADRPAADLNSAQQKMLDLTRALATRPRLLLLDELAAGLNPAELNWIAGRIKALAATGMAVIVVEHLMGFIEQITDRVIVLNAGKEIFEGTLATAVREPQVIEVFLGGEHAH